MTLKGKGILPKVAPAVLSQLSIGIACASYWRGAWYVLDDNLFPNNDLHSATASLCIGSAGLVLTQDFIAKRSDKDVMRNKHVKLSSLRRFGTLYCVATSCVLVWRGTWMFWDIAYERYGTKNGESATATDSGHLTKSGILSHSIALGSLLAFGRFSSVLAPPARVSILKDLTFKAKTWKEYSSAAKSLFK